MTFRGHRALRYYTRTKEVGRGGTTMIVKDDFLAKLRRYFLLNLYEVKIWTALLSRGVSTAGELSDIANVPRSRSYDVLESLEKKGFVVMKVGKPIKYIAVPPAEIVERVKKNIHNYAKDQTQRLEELKGSDLLHELDMLHNQGIELVEPSDLSGSLKGRHNLYNHLELMLKSAEETITVVTTAKGLIRKVDGLKQTFAELKKRGVKIRIAAPITKESKEAAKDIAEVAEVRNLEKIQARFMIIDGKELTFMILNDEDVHPSYDVGIWVNTPFFAGALEQFFEIAWKELKPLAKVKA